MNDVLKLKTGVAITLVLQLIGLVYFATRLTTQMEGKLEHLEYRIVALDKRMDRLEAK